MALQASSPEEVVACEKMHDLNAVPVPNNYSSENQDLANEQVDEALISKLFYHFLHLNHIS